MYMHYDVPAITKKNELAAVTNTNLYFNDL